MPRTRADKPKVPPVDKLKAVILERKLARGLTYDQIAAAADVSPDYMRKIISSKHTDEWNPKIKREVCRYLGLNIKIVIEDLFNLDS